MISGRYSETIASNIPGTIRAAATANKGQVNPAAFMAGKFHLNATEIYCVAPDLGTVPQTPVWVQHVTRSLTEYGVSGFLPCLTTNGPGVVHAWINEGNGGATRVARYDALTDSITFFDQVGTTDPTADSKCYGMMVKGSLLFLHWGVATSAVRTQVFDLESGAFADDLLPNFSTGPGNMPCTANGNVYTSNVNGGFVQFHVWLGGEWVVVKTSTVVAASAGSCNWARDGLVNSIHYTAASGGGAVWAQYDPATGIVTDLTSSLDPILQPGGGLDAVSPASSWRWGFYVDTSEFGNPRYMLQVALGAVTVSPGVVLFEHTTGPDAVSLIGDTGMNTGTNCLLHCPISAAGISWTEGNLWGVMVNKPAKDPAGTLLTFRFGGDAGNADTNLYLQYTAPPGAPENHGTLSAPAGGLGQVGASLVDTGGGVWHVHNWDADGVTDLTVVHNIVVPDGVPSGTETAWSMRASKNELTP
jgi:hypothetical protein